MAEDDIENLFDAAAEEFDPKDFIDSVYKTIYAYQSEAAIAPNQVFEKPSDVSSAKGSESSLNTFYRILGLPASRPEKDLSFKGFISSSLSTSAVEERKRSLLSQFGTLNYFPEKDFGFNDEGISIAKDARDREQKFADLKNKTRKDHLTMVQNPLPLSGSINGGPRRESIFPLIVTADVPVFPLRNRIAPLFHSGDMFRGGVRLSRPFLEHVFYIRTKNFTGGGGSKANSIREALIGNIEAEIFNLPVTDSEKSDVILTENQQAALIELTDDSNVLFLQLYDKFIKILKKAAYSYRGVLDLAKELDNAVLYMPEPKRFLEEKAGSASMTNEEAEALLKEVLGDSAGGVGSRAIDEKISALKAQRAQVESLLQLLPTADILESDKVRRVAQLSVPGNVTPDALISEFTSLIGYERKVIDDQLKEVNDEKQKLFLRYETVRHGIMLYTGEMVGLSIFDVICVLLALFTVEESQLINLMNKEAIDRLVSNDSFYTKNRSGTGLFSESLDIVGGDVNSGLAALEEQVRKHFRLAESFFRQASSKAADQ